MTTDPPHDWMTRHRRPLIAWALAAALLSASSPIAVLLIESGPPGAAWQARCSASI